MSKEPRVRLSYAIELVVAVAIGLALVRAAAPIQEFRAELARYPRSIQYGVYLTEYGDPFCLGLVVVEGVTLAVETFRRRRPGAWGFGRTTWSVCFFVVLLISLEEFVWAAASEILVGGNGRPDVGEILSVWWVMFMNSSSNPLTQTSTPLCLAGLLMTSLAAGWPRDHVPDAREWTGRFFFGALLILYLTHKMCYWYWE
jgi:hypothetical protein